MRSAPSSLSAGSGWVSSRSPRYSFQSRPASSALWSTAIARRSRWRSSRKPRPSSCSASSWRRQPTGVLEARTRPRRTSYGPQELVGYPPRDRKGRDLGWLVHRQAALHGGGSVHRLRRALVADRDGGVVGIS